jgi:4Fe-4S ferredoxin
MLDIYKLLPKTNCKKCGYATCMAYAAALREGRTTVECCSPLLEAAQEKSREQLTQLMQV